MRLIGTLQSEPEAHRFGAYLKANGMETNCEPIFDPQTGHVDYQIWIHDEDRIQEAEKIFDQFRQSPSDPQYDTAAPPPPPLPRQPQPVPRTFKTHLTTFFLILCTLVFYLQTFEELPILKEGLPEEAGLFAPINLLFYYDLPAPIAQLGKEIQQDDPAAKTDLVDVEKMPFWHGIYDWVVLKIKKESTAPAEGPLFSSIRQGEIWRLFTPVLLHGNLLHILFNMIWLWVLGRPIEMRIGPFRTLILTLVTGIGSNTVQYLMSGPFFLGYSGIVMGLAGFIWMRERLAPWEGYPLNRPTILFIALFIGAIFVLQVFTFFMQIFTTHTFFPNIANSAHIAGAIIGALLAKLHYFSRVKT